MARLERLFAAGMDRGKIALAMGRSRAIIRRRAVRLGLIKLDEVKRGPPKRKPAKPEPPMRVGLVTLPPLHSLQMSGLGHRLS
jgi:hypothetical protein